jgi:peptidoglycan-associated lipoprotein
MRKHSQLSLALLFTLSLLTACGSKMQGPTAPATVLPVNSGLNTANYRPPNSSDFGRNGSASSENLSGANNGINDANGLSERPGGTLPNINWDQPPAELIVATVYFGFNQFNIDPSERPKLEAAAKVMAADPTLHVVAVGHCDWYGSDQYNLVLSDKRANTVKAYLAQLGASAAQTDVLARGKYGAVPDVKKDSPQAKNDRRVDIVKIPAGATLPLGPPPVAGAAAPAADSSAPAPAAATGTP